jgi:hypothetical protein
MTLSDLANVGTLASALAVLGSLVYLIIQFRQTERNQRALLNQAVATRAVESLRSAAEPHIAALRARVYLGEVDFTPTEVIQLTFMLRMNVTVSQDSQLQHAAGMIDRLTFENILAVLRTHLRWPVFRAIWSILRTEFPDNTTAFVDSVLTETPVAEFRDLPAEIKGLLAPASLS